MSDSCSSFRSWLGERMRQRREELGLTLSEVAAALTPDARGPAWHAADVDTVETTAHGSIRVSDLPALCNVLDCSADWLLGRTPRVSMGEELPDLSPRRLLPVDYGDFDDDAEPRCGVGYEHDLCFSCGERRNSNGCGVAL